MAIVNMSKFHLFSFDHDRNELLKNLQKFRYVHLNDLREEEFSASLQEVERSEELVALDEQINQSKWAIERLDSFVGKPGMVQSLKEGQKHFTLQEIRDRAATFDFESHYRELSNLNTERERLLQRNGNIDAMVEELSPWITLETPVEKLYRFEHVKVFTGTIPLRYKEDFLKALEPLDMTTATEVHQDKNFAYFIVIAEKEKILETEEVFRINGFTPAEVKTKGKVSDEIDRLHKEKQDNETKSQELMEEMKSKVGNLEDYEIYYDYLRNEKLKLLSSEKFMKTEQVDVIEGYVPTERLKDLDRNISEVLGDSYYFVAEEAKKEDPKVPIILKNNKFVSPFESLTEMYAMPRYNEIDPTPLFAPFYFIFAGIMVGDFGYGALVFLATLFALKSFNLKPSVRRFVRFFNYIGLSASIWGLLFGSVFGGLIEMPSLINPAEDYMEMIILSLILGGIHLFFGLAIQAYMDLRDGKPKDALFDVGFWYMALVGLVVVILSRVFDMKDIVVTVSKIVMIIGMIGIVATGGRQEESIGGKIGWGVYSLYGITSYIGDIVSYLRLMALALASSFIGVAVNLIAGMLFGSGIIGIIVAIAVFAIFHLFNAFLSYLSAYVHSARLIYVEMFNKFYEGGGVPFKKMLEQSDYFNIEEE